MYIELPNTVEGLVHISTLGKNYHYNSDYLCMQCNDDIVYKLGDIVKVVVVGASKEMHTVDFEIANNQKEQKMAEKDKTIKNKKA